MPQNVYLETTIPSYLAARPSLHTVIFTHQQLTQLWWDHRRSLFQLLVSELVLQECAAGDPELAKRRLDLLSGISVLPPAGAILELAEALVNGGPIPENASADAIHVATATVYGCDYLLTWNCRHIANAEIRRAAAHVVRRHGYELPVICTPEELMGADNEERTS